MLLQRHHLRICRKRHKSRTQAQRIFKTAPLYAVTNPEESAPQDIWTAFTAFFESLWSTSSTAAAQKSGMSYVYDEDGTLIAQTLTGGAQTSWGQSARYVYLPTASGPMPVAAIYGTKHYAIQSDHLNTPRRLIQSDGQVAWQWAYSAFGDEKPTIASNRFANTALNQSFGSTAVPAVTFNLRYPGQYFDQESGLHYNYHRSYSATVGRYTQADPIGLDGVWNRFGYVGGNALSFIDPLGLDRWGSDPSMKRIPTDDKSVLDWLCSYGGTGSPTTDLMNGRNNGWDRYDDNLPAAERFAEMMDGNYANNAPWRSDDFNMGQYLYKKYRQGVRGGKGNGSKDAGFVAKWGAMGAFYFEQNISWVDWKQRNCTCGK